MSNGTSAVVSNFSRGGTETHAIRRSRLVCGTDEASSSSWLSASVPPRRRSRCSAGPGKTAEPAEARCSKWAASRGGSEGGAGTASMAASHMHSGTLVSISSQLYAGPHCCTWVLM
jgi:hypothetical protein